MKNFCVKTKLNFWVLVLVVMLFSLGILTSCGIECKGCKKTYLTNLNTKSGLNAYSPKDSKVCEVPAKKHKLELVVESDDYYLVEPVDGILGCPGQFYLKKSKWVAPFKEKETVQDNKLPQNSDDYSKGWKKDYEAFLTDYIKNNSKLLEYKDNNYWMKFFRSMSKAESNHSPKATYKEPNIVDANGDRVISSGLLQVSLESGKYYKCPFKVQEDLFNPYKNLQCGVIIMNRFVVKDGMIYGKKDGKWKGGSRYWAVLRNTTSGYKRFMNEFNK